MRGEIGRQEDRKIRGEDSKDLSGWFHIVKILISRKRKKGIKIRKKYMLSHSIQKNRVNLV